ncbi:MFS general substrate transporter [Pseudohyphozyma bogoriensis]|nr:MFS general substrate transporter [Pseudohyphozyma bogoriensis]
MWELLWLGGFSTILLVFLLPETSHANILLRRAERLRALTGNLAYRSQEEITNAKRTPGLVFQEAILRPFQITVLDPSIGFANVYTGLVYAFYYTFFVAFPIVYGPEVFNFSFGAQGVVYVSIIVGGIVGFIIYVGYQLLYMNGYWYPTRGWPVNEKRLEPAIISSAFAPIGLFIFAWTSRVECHWIGSCIGTALYALSNFITLQCIFFYIVLSYPAYAASILAANDLLRATAATGFLHIGIPMFRTLHIDGGVSLLAGLTCFGVPGIYLIYRYGARLRAKSRFAVGDSQ